MKKIRLNKECMVCGGELWILEDEVCFEPNQYILGKRIGTDRETVRCKCTTCGTEYTIEGEYRNVKELKEWVKHERNTKDKRDFKAGTKKME